MTHEVRLQSGGLWSLMWGCGAGRERGEGGGGWEGLREVGGEGRGGGGGNEMREVKGGT